MKTSLLLVAGLRTAVWLSPATGQVSLMIGEQGAAPTTTTPPLELTDSGPS